MVSTNFDNRIAVWCICTVNPTTLTMCAARYSSEKVETVHKLLTLHATWDFAPRAAVNTRVLTSDRSDTVMVTYTKYVVTSFPGSLYATSGLSCRRNGRQRHETLCYAVVSLSLTLNRWRASDALMRDHMIISRLLHVRSCTRLSVGELAMQ